jgi:hypothetical protein
MTTREQEVAADVVCNLLKPKTVNAMKKELCRIARAGRDRPAPDTRLGLFLIAATTADIRPPSRAEIMRIVPRIYHLWTDSERSALE